MAITYTDCGQLTTRSADDIRVGDVVFVTAPKGTPVPDGWTDVTVNRESSLWVLAYRFHVAGDVPLHEVWPIGVQWATYRGVQRVDQHPGVRWTSFTPTPTSAEGEL